MTKLGKLLVDDGIEKGIERGLEQGLEQGMKALTEICKEFGADFRQTVEKVKIRFWHQRRRSTGSRQKILAVRKGI